MKKNKILLQLDPATLGHIHTCAEMISRFERGIDEKQLRLGLRRAVRRHIKARLGSMQSPDGKL